MLVVLQLNGGNDSLNTFIPYTARQYREARPTLAIAEDAMLKITDRFALHPSMGRLKDLYLAGRLAFISSVGFASLDRSHFRCRDIWQSGIETSGGSTRAHGWLGRYADLYLKDDATAATTFAVAQQAPLGLSSALLSGTTIIGPENFGSSTSLIVDPGDPEDEALYKEALFDTYDQQRTGDPEAIRICGNAAFQGVQLFGRIPSQSTVTYPDSYLGRAFKLIARILAADIGTDIAWVSLDGFDTHGLQANTHSALLSDVSDTLAAFQDDIGQRGLANRVVVLAWSEFGRRVSENGNRGTDHGKAGTVFLMGQQVKGGSYGAEPDLSALDEGDLKTKTDFRAVYWTLIQDWFERDPLPVLQNRYENLGFINRASKRRAARH